MDVADGEGEREAALGAVLLRGVCREWLPLFDLDALGGLTPRLLAAQAAGSLAPPFHLVFEAFRYCGPSDVVAVIVGQDPFPGRGHAQGLAFSVPAGIRPPPALKQVFACLGRAGLRAAAGPSGDLRPWAAQGVLLLNSALTTEVGARNGHKTIWNRFISVFLTRFCAARARRPLHFLLWGGPARALAPVAAKQGHHVHEWSHPSPMGDNAQPEERRFRLCPHFEAVNSALAAAGSRPLCWDNGAAAFAFADGACARNGQPDARASFAAVIVGAQFGRTIIRGAVLPAKYALADEADPGRGLAAVAGSAARPTNNRGELLAAIYALFALLRGCALGRVELVSDSWITIQTLLEWYPTRLREGTSHLMKNHDLVLIAWRLLGRLRAQASSVVLTHTRGHRRRPPASAPPRAHLLWWGNRAADGHAALVPSAAPRGAPPAEAGVTLLAGPPALRRALDQARG